jgi:hypothetical protein
MSQGTCLPEHELTTFLTTITEVVDLAHCATADQQAIDRVLASILRRPR